MKEGRGGRTLLVKCAGVAGVGLHVDRTAHCFLLPHFQRAGIPALVVACQDETTQSAWREMNDMGGSVLLLYIWIDWTRPCRLAVL